MATPHNVVLTWVAPANMAPGWTFDVFRGTVAGKENATPLASGITGTTYTDADPALVEGQEYFYYVETVTNGVPPLQSLPSNEANATIPFVTPDAPTGLVAVAS